MGLTTAFDRKPSFHRGRTGNNLRSIRTLVSAVGGESGRFRFSDDSFFCKAS